MVTKVWELLADVRDPEIPVLSILDLGIVEYVKKKSDAIEVGIIPTYVGCPAMDLISTLINEQLFGSGFRNFSIKILKSPIWGSERISISGRKSMLEYGIAPPDQSMRIDALLTGSAKIKCPQCGSDHSEVVSAFGSTACKAMMRCKDCLEPFEYFKCH